MEKLVNRATEGYSCLFNLQSDAFCSDKWWRCSANRLMLSPAFHGGWDLELCHRQTGEGWGSHLLICTNQKGSNRILLALIVSVIRNVTFGVCIRWGMAQCGNPSWKCGDSTETRGRNNAGSEGIRKATWNLDSSYFLTHIIWKINLKRKE